MSTPRERRIGKELADIHADEVNSGVSANPLNESNLLHLEGVIFGPPDTPYAKGRYLIDIQIPDNYPFKPPVMKFKTSIWHPNVSSQTGAICLDTLSSGWSPVQTIKTALLSLRMLLEFPNAADPQDAEVAGMMTKQPAEFARKAHQWAVAYAGAQEETDLDFSQYGDPNPDAASGESTDEAAETARYGGYNRNLVGRFTGMGFPVEDVVAAFQHLRLHPNNGRDYELEEASMGDVTAHLLGER